MSVVALGLLLAAQESSFGVTGFPLRHRTEEETRQLYKDYGDCVVSLFKKAATAAILDNVDDETLMKRRRALIEPDCLKSSVPKGMTQTTFLQADRIRYSVADALVRTELKDAPAPVTKAVPPLEHWASGEPPSPLSENAKSAEEKEHQEALRQYHERYMFAQFSRFGECVVRTDPAAAKSLLMADPLSPEEAAGFDRLKPAFANCIPEGQRFALTKLALRGTIAVNYYRLANAASRVSATTLAGDAK